MRAKGGAGLGLSQNRISHLERHADELSVRQLLTWCAVVGLELRIAERQADAHRTGEPGVGVGTPPEW